MPAYLLSSVSTVLIYSPTLIEDALICSFRSSPSGSVLVRTVPHTSFVADGGKALLDSLSDAVESILGEGIAIDATGTQGTDSSSLLYDAVLFTVAYVPPLASPGEITATVEIPVTTLTADTQFASFIPGLSAPELILDTYNKLKALAGG